MTPFSVTQSSIIRGEIAPGLITFPVRRLVLPAAAVRSREERLALQLRDLLALGLRPSHDHRIVAHGSADEALLARKGRRCAFADDHDLLTIVLFTPREVVVVVHELELAPAEQ